MYCESRCPDGVWEYCEDSRLASRRSSNRNLTEAVDSDVSPMLFGSCGADHIHIPQGPSFLGFHALAVILLRMGQRHACSISICKLNIVPALGYTYLRIGKGRPWKSEVYWIDTQQWCFGESVDIIYSMKRYRERWLMKGYHEG